MKILLICFQICLFGSSLEGKCPPCQEVTEGGLMGIYEHVGGNFPQCSDGCGYRRDVDQNIYCLEEGNGMYTTKKCSQASGFKCGVKKAGSKRIVGGVETEVNEYPWMAGLVYENGNWSEWRCGAALVAAEWIFTAAHCVFNNSKLVEVFLGEHDLSSTTESTKMSFTIEKVITHEGYVDATLENDVALLKLTEKVDLNIFTPACLPTKGDTFAGQTAYAVGWGKTLDYDSPYAEKLREVALTVVTTDVCKSAMAPAFVDDTMVCAGDPGQDGCLGDSGGPLTVADASTDQHTIIGATSWGIGCATNGTYGVWAAVAIQSDWIAAQFGANGGATLTP